MTEYTECLVDVTPRDLAGDLCDRGRERRTLDTDDRYRRLLGEAAWSQLPRAVQRRFSRRHANGETIVYRGHVEETRLTLAGRVLSQMARIAGAPLPLDDGATGPAVVIVTEAPEMSGHLWTRIYARPGRLPQAIRSAKRFQGPTGLEEDLGHGLSMALTLAVEDGVLVFRSTGYDLHVLGRRWRLPAWLSPGTCEIGHRDDGGGRFTFTLRLTHPVLGQIVSQTARFEDEDARPRRH